MASFWQRFKEAQSAQYQQLGVDRSRTQQTRTTWEESETVGRASTSHPQAQPSVGLGAFTTLVLLVTAMWAVGVADLVTPGSLSWLGVRSWSVPGLLGILTSPLVHANLIHLIANTIPLLVLGVMVSVEGAWQFVKVTAMTAVVAGLGVWVVNAPGAVTVGASGLVFGYFGYILGRAYFAPLHPRKLLWVLLAVVVAVTYGASMLLGALPIRYGISWQAHLFGALGGWLAAYLLHRTIRKA